MVEMSRRNKDGTSDYDVDGGRNCQFGGIDGDTTGATAKRTRMGRGLRVFAALLDKYAYARL